MMRVHVEPALIRWARERAGRSISDLSTAFPRLADWESGEVRPTLKQLERFAKTTYTPIGILFLQRPPVDEMPIPDFRRISNDCLRSPSPDLLDTLFACQQRQEWYHDFVRSMGGKPLPFVGSVTVESDVEGVAASLQEMLGFDMKRRSKARTWTEAFRRLVEGADSLGVLVMVNGVVGNNTSRKLDPEEFRGFAITDDLAPLVFVNGADAKAAQMFTLAHELAHVWLGRSAVSDAQPSWVPEHGVEGWCNKVAAEFLVPLSHLREEYQGDRGLEDDVLRLGRYYKVSSLVILRRIHDAGELTRDEFSSLYQQELARLRSIKKGSGGNFYRTQAARVSKRFAQALIASTLEGQTLYRDALRLLGFSKIKTFNELGHTLGVI